MKSKTLITTILLSSFICNLAYCGPKKYVKKNHRSPTNEESSLMEWILWNKSKNKGLAYLSYYYFKKENTEKCDQYKSLCVGDNVAFTEGSYGLSRRNESIIRSLSTDASGKFTANLIVKDRYHSSSERNPICENIFQNINNIPVEKIAFNTGCLRMNRPSSDNTLAKTLCIGDVVNVTNLIAGVASKLTIAGIYLDGSLALQDDKISEDEKRCQSYCDPNRQNDPHERCNKKEDELSKKYNFLRTGQMYRFGFNELALDEEGAKSEVRNELLK